MQVPDSGDGRRRRRVGVFGGTFDPPHLGHMVVASEVRWACRLDELLLVVANDPWQKSATREVTPAALRLAMVEQAFADREGLTPSSIEIDRGGPSYTIDTLLELRRQLPEDDLVLVLGRDSVERLDSWHRAAELAELVEIACVERPGGPPTSERSEHRHAWKVSSVDVPMVDLSSTDLRARCGDGRPLEFLVADGVRSMIAEHGLYGWNR